VSDVIMPDKSGYEVCAFVRATATLAATPVLLISGIVNDEVTKQAETCKADGVLKKPFQGTSLKDKVLELIAKRQKPLEAPESKSTAAPVAAPTIGIKAMPAPQQAAAQAPAPGLKLMPTHAAPAQSSADVHSAGNGNETGGRPLPEQVRTETLVKRTVELEAELGRMKGVQALLEAERRRTQDLESKVAASESQALRVPQLEAALQSEQEAARAARQDALAAQALAGRVAQLEAELEAERAAETQLVQQLSDMEKTAASAAHTAQQVVELQTALAAERQKASAGVLGKEEAQAKVRELDGLLAVERERNAELLRRVTESEQAALNATKRLEEMARKLGEIAGLASQLGKGMG
jgi:CheY-like chemotaxis protein